ncbi:MAG: Protein kinase [Myxococcaceae bacterium]|nr:Protein kinase [Myxococcaceae bacterium]
MPGTAEVDSAELALPQEGDVLEGKYKIEHILGEGGMCVVYAARHLQLEERVAVKMLRPEMMEQPDIVERFLREGRAAIRIHSEHVVRIFDVGMLPSKNPYLVMECLQGSDLDALLLANGPLPIQAAVDYVLQAGEAIAEAHTLGIVHRDLKPANLFLTRRADGAPWVKVLDFGISKVSARKSRNPDLGLTGAAAIMGSPRYMSPEQMRSSKNVDGRTDIWSLGAILHELIAGEPPFKGDTMPEICANILQDPPTSLLAIRPDVPPALEAAIMRCLEKDVGDRFAHMGDVAVALAEFASPSGRASAHRIVGILQSSTHPVQGGILVNPSSEGTAWGSTDPSWNTVPLKRSASKLLGIAAGAMTLVAGGALATFMIVGRPSTPSRTTATATTATSLTTTSQGDVLADGRSIPPPTAVEATRDAGAATPTTAATNAGNNPPPVRAPMTTAASRRRAAPPAYQPPYQAPTTAPRPRATNPDGTDVLFDERK